MAYDLPVLVVTLDAHPWEWSIMTHDVDWLVVPPSAKRDHLQGRQFGVVIYDGVSPESFPLPAVPALTMVYDYAPPAGPDPADCSAPPKS